MLYSSRKKYENQTKGFCSIVDQTLILFGTPVEKRENVLRMKKCTAD